MKHPQIIVLTSILAVAVGMVGINGASDDVFGLTNNPDVSTYEGYAYQGHIVVKHFDSEGNLVSYQQTDNLVNDAGKNCSANLLFGTSFANCTSPTLFDDIALSTNDGTGFLAADTFLANECDGTPDCGTGLNARLAGTVSADTVASAGGSAVAQIQATFTKTAGGAITIESAGLFDATTSGNMFAERAFSSGVTLNTNDSIQVTWLITLA